MILWVFGNSDSLMNFLVAVKISWWRYQLKSPLIERLFLEITISSCISLNVVLFFSQLSFQFLLNLSQWHSLPVSRCNLLCRLLFKSFCELLVDWYTFQFQFSFLACSKILFAMSSLKMNILSSLSVHFIVFILLEKFSSSQFNLSFSRL